MARRIPAHGRVTVSLRRSTVSGGPPGTPPGPSSRRRRSTARIAGTSPRKGSREEAGWAVLGSPFRIARPGHGARRHGAGTGQWLLPGLPGNAVPTSPPCLQPPSHWRGCPGPVPSRSPSLCRDPILGVRPKGAPGVSSRLSTAGQELSAPHCQQGWHGTGWSGLWNRSSSGCVCPGSAAGGLALPRCSGISGQLQRALPALRGPTSRLAEIPTGPQQEGMYPKQQRDPVTCPGRAGPAGPYSLLLARWGHYSAALSASPGIFGVPVGQVHEGASSPQEHRLPRPCPLCLCGAPSTCAMLCLLPPSAMCPPALAAPDALFCSRPTGACSAHVPACPQSPLPHYRLLPPSLSAPQMSEP